MLTSNNELPPCVVIRDLRQLTLLPRRPRRRQTPEFAATKARLKRDGFWRCWICGATECLQVHHFLIQRAAWPALDPGKVKETAELFDAYGYGAALKDQPLSGPDDVRLALVLCVFHHSSGSGDGAANGIHDIEFGAWLMQRLVRPGMDLIPQHGESADHQLGDLERASAPRTRPG